VIRPSQADFTTIEGARMPEGLRDQTKLQAFQPPGLPAFKLGFVFYVFGVNFYFFGSGLHESLGLINLYKFLILIFFIFQEEIRN
jgi:hypothetical protein